MTKFFSKLSHGATKFFNKVGHDAPKILNKVSVVARKIGNTVDKVASNPIVQAAANAYSPGAGAMLGQAGQAAHQISGITNKNNYAGGVNTVSQNILEKAQAMNKTNPTAIQFH